MRYFEVTFHIMPFSEDVADVFSALLADEGFEAFDTHDHVLVAWVQQQYYSEEKLCRAIDAIPFPGTTVTYETQEAPDENWNKRWEEEVFKPIVIRDGRVEQSASTQALIAIHDTTHFDVPEAQYDICINPCQAFGTGSHETTRMILRQLLTMPMCGRRVVDAGTGTGILAIFCHQLGAENIVAYDIDEWSVRNTKENITLNGISKGIEVLHGDCSVLAGMKQNASLLIANINRNILLADMPYFAKNIEEGGELLLSGFYIDDVPMLIEAAGHLGFSLIGQSEDHGWAMLLLKKGNLPSQ